MRKFIIEAKDRHSKARTGLIRTKHGNIQTPCFIPDATLGTVKHLSPTELNLIPLQIILGNIYHLSLRPGIGLIKKMGGLHQFINWRKPVITDSGGFQAFSLVYRNKMGKILPNGIEFKDHLTGKTHLLTPKTSIKMQLDIGSDILMVLDFPVSPNAPEKDNRRSVELTVRWAKESKSFFTEQKSAKNKILMAIVQGADSKKMRRECFERLEEIGFPGFGFGGPPLNYEILEYTASLIPEEKIRYVMGGGTPLDILESVKMGWDLFDCVIPTRNARHGTAYTFHGTINLNQEKYKFDQKPIDPDCPCFACQHHTRSFLRHLFKVKEPLAARLVTLHNLSFYTQLMKKIRTSIKNEQFSKIYKELKDGLSLKE